MKPCAITYFAAFNSWSLSMYTIPMNIRVTVTIMQCCHKLLKIVENKWKNHFFKMKVGSYRDDLKHQKGRNKGSLHSKDSQSYRTPSLYLCFIVYKQSLIYQTKILSFIVLSFLVLQAIPYPLSCWRNDFSTCWHYDRYEQSQFVCLYAWRSPKGQWHQVLIEEGLDRRKNPKRNCHQSLWSTSCIQEKQPKVSTITA